MQKEKTCDSTAIGEHIRRRKMGKLKKQKKKRKLENNVNVVFNSNEEKYLLTKPVASSVCHKLQSIYA